MASVQVTVKRSRPAATSCGSESCGLLLSRLARAANSALAGALERIGLRAVHFAILHRLAEGGPSSQADLAGALRLQPSNLVRVLDELEDAELIARDRDPEDRRRQVVVISAAGAVILRKAEAAAERVEAELLSSLTPAEQAELGRLLGRVASHACSRSCSV